MYNTVQPSAQICVLPLQADPAAAALASAAAPPLDKLRELLDKAAAALKGLALAHVHAPLAAALLRPLGATLAISPPSSSSSARDSDSGSAAAAASASAAGPQTAPEVLAVAAQAALFAYIKPANVGHAAKLVKALHTLFSPVAKKAAAGGGGGGAPLVPELPAALEALPQSLPYVCLCVKAVGARVQPGHALPQVSLIRRRWHGVWSPAATFAAPYVATSEGCLLHSGQGSCSSQLPAAATESHAGSPRLLCSCRTLAGPLPPPPRVPPPARHGGGVGPRV